jgi:hypothetical protein
MHRSSIGLAAAAALTIAALGPANAHFAPPRHFVSPARPMMMNHFRQAERFGAHDRGGFRRGRDQHGLQLDGGWGGGYPAAGVIPSTANVPPIILGPGAPTINITVVTSPPGARLPEPTSYAANAGPKIIVIGSRGHSPHIGKLPRVVYGVKPL